MLSQYEALTRYQFSGGKLYHKQKNCKNIPIGAEVGSRHNGGYIQTTIDGKPILLHRLVWVMAYGFIPTVIDHIDGDRTNNRLDNLRMVTSSKNNANRKTNHAKSGILGLSYRPKRDNWRGVIKLEGKTYERESKDKKVIETWLIETRESLGI